MNLNQVRLLEACHRYLVDKVNVDIRDEFVNDTLVFETNGKLVTFDTYQDKSGAYSFIDFRLGYYEEIEDYARLEVSDIFQILSLKDGQVSTLALLTDKTKVRQHIFKLLSQIDTTQFDEEIKKDNIVYNWKQLDNNLQLPFYQVSDTETFTLVSII